MNKSKFKPRKKVNVKQYITLPTNKSNINFLYLALIISAVFLVYFNSLAGQFVWDDRFLIIDNKFIKDWRYIRQIFNADLFSGAEQAMNFYRPVQTVSLIVDYHNWKLNPFGYHITNIILHSLVSILLYYLTILFFKNKKIAFFTALIFAIHPIHTEAVAYIAGRADSLCAIFMIASLILFAKFEGLWPYLFSLLSFILALLSKEYALIYPLLLMLLQDAYLSKEKKFILKLMPFFIIIIIYGLLRYTALDFFKEAGAVTSTSFIPLVNRLLTIPKIIFIYLGMLFFPINQHMERGIAVSNSVFESSTILSLIGLIILVVIAIRAYRKREKILFFGLSWFFIAILPYLNIVPINALLSEHWLYTASFGFFLLIVNYLVTIPKHIGMSILIPFLFIYSIGTILQNTYWANEFIQYRRVLEFSPNNARIHYNLGLAYAEKGCFEDAVAEFKRAIELKPNFIDSYINLGYTYQEKKLIGEAEEFFKEAMTVKPNSYLPYYYLANLYNDTGRFSESIELYKKALSLKQKNPDIYFDLGRAYDKNDNIEDSVKMYQKTIELDPLYIDAYLNLGAIFAENGRFDEANVIWLKGLKLDPESLEIKQNLEKLKRLNR